MQEVLNIFKTITTIPHCSFKTEKLREFIVNECEKTGAKVEVDCAGNILATKGSPKICLQSHYDMVCVGDAPKLELYEEDGKLRAKNSSLGADNGIGVAMMLYLLNKKEDIQALFTNDEEVGLIGANGLDLKITAKYLLNLDSEEEGSICLGCAGGVDLLLSKSFKMVEVEEDFKAYEVETINFIGGHSGVDIDKDIKNAIKELAFFLKENKCKIASINGGEAGNAIPKRVVAKVFSKQELKSIENIKVKVIHHDRAILNISDDLLDFLVTFPSGVRSYNKEIGAVQTSINLATVWCKNSSIMIEISPRAMSGDDMEKLLLESETLFEKFGFELRKEHPYPSWKPLIGEFAKRVQEVSKKHFTSTEFYAIHAGLECGVLISKNPHLEAVSIGPNINYPHSTREEVELESIRRVLRVVEELF